MNFGQALETLKQGGQVYRDGWNGAGMWLSLRPEEGIILPYLQLHYPVNSRPYPAGARVPWAPSQTDVLAEDWVVRNVTPATEVIVRVPAWTRTQGNLFQLAQENGVYPELDDVITGVSVEGAVTGAGRVMKSDLSLITEGPTLYPTGYHFHGKVGTDDIRLLIDPDKWQWEVRNQQDDEHDSEEAYLQVRLKFGKQQRPTVGDGYKYPVDRVRVPLKVGPVNLFGLLDEQVAGFDLTDSIESVKLAGVTLADGTVIISKVADPIVKEGVRWVGVLGSFAEAPFAVFVNPQTAEARLSVELPDYAPEMFVELDIQRVNYNRRC